MPPVYVPDVTDPGAGAAAGAVLRALAPAADAFADPLRFASLLHAVDPALTFNVAALAEALEDLDDAARAIAAAVEAGSDALGDLAADDPEAAAAAAVALLGHVATAVAEVRGVADALAAWDPAALGIPGGDRAYWAGVLEGLLIRLLVEALEHGLPAMDGVLRAFGVVVEEPDGRVALRLDRLGGLVGEPGAVLADVAGWGGALDLDWVTGALADAFASVGTAARVRPLRPELAALLPAPQPAGARALEVPLVGGRAWPLPGMAELGVVVAAVSGGGGTEPDALLVANLAWGSAGASITTPSGWELAVTGEADATGRAAVLLRPGEDARDVGADAGAALSASVARTWPSPLPVFGTPTSTRLVVGGAMVEVALVPGTPPEVVLSAALESAELVIVAGSPFVAALLGGDQVEVALAADLRWSSRTGLTLAGGAGLAVVLPLHAQVGPVLLEDLELALRPSGDAGGSAAVATTLTIGATLGPFAVTVYGLGLDVTIGPAEGATIQLGPLGLAVAPVPPNGLAFSIDAGAVVGDGLILVEGDRYVGGLSLDVLAVGVDAFVVVDTSLPGDPDGFALFATLTLRFPGIPLGFGFSLTGLGGLLAVNRAIDAEALAEGLRDGAADAVLFPEDPQRDADQLVAQLDAYFPVLVGNTVVGPVAELSWGVPIIVTGQLGVVISWPDGVIAVLGSIELVLPDPAAPALELHLDVLGAIDLAAGTVLVVASLYDSRLLGVIELSGDAGLYVSWLGQPFFLLSVGGFHPGYEPPGCVPSLFEDLRPMRAEVQVGLGVTALLESYVAVTSNSVQFGGGVSIAASAEFLGVTYTARGWFDVDVLLQFSPFLFVAEASAGVGVYAGNRELMGVSLDLHLEGPDPWYASGSARFTFFIVKVRFAFAVGGRAAPEVPASADVLDLVCQALEEPGAWSTEPAAGLGTGVVLAGAEEGVRVRPDEVVVVHQGVAPLGRTLERFGELTPEQTRVDLGEVAVVDAAGGAVLSALDVDQVTEWFAPAMFDELPDQARLAAPSYEPMVAGVRLGAAGVGLAAAEAVAAPAGHETEVWEPATGTAVKLGRVVAVRGLATTIAASAAAHTVRRLKGPVATVPAVKLAPQTYAAIDPTTADPLTARLPYAAAHAAARTANARVAPAVGRS
jgi:hypothetical protein